MNQQVISIGSKLIGYNQPVFIIAEAGVNHNGDFELAKQLVDVAVQAGADAIKFQTFKSEDLVTKSVQMASYQKINTGKIESQLEMLKKLELKLEDFAELKQYCDQQGIIFLTTPHSGGEVLEFVDPLLPAYKIGSADLTNFPLLQQISSFKKPMILGTGMASMEEVQAALSLLHSQGNHQVVMLHCTSNYPCPLDEVNLNCMHTMQKELDCLIGYSDHTMGDLVPLFAVAKGACVLEKHFTLSRSMKGPDHQASLEPDELTAMIGKIRQAEIALGSSIKQPSKSEKEILQIGRKSLVSTRELLPGEKIQLSDIIIKRPGTGISPQELPQVLGKTVKTTIPADQLIEWSQLT